jgi:hypothetical protein
MAFGVDDPPLEGPGELPQLPRRTVQPNAKAMASVARRAEVDLRLEREVTGSRAGTNHVPRGAHTFDPGRFSRR